MNGKGQMEKHEKKLLKNRNKISPPEYSKVGFKNNHYEIPIRNLILLFN